MFAVMKTGGKQYKVQSGDTLRIEKLAADAGETVQFNDILMLGGDKIAVGTPTVDGAAVQAEVVDQFKGEKLVHFVKRRRKHGSQRTKGHRQQLTMVRITEILASGGDKSGVKAAIGAGSVAGVAIAAAKPARKAEVKAEAPKAEPAAEVESVQPENLLTEARGGKADNLKKISGIWSRLESILHEIGVFHFDQIAAWGPAEIAYMNDRLSFKGRIERDNWIEQAAKFAKEQG